MKAPSAFRLFARLLLAGWTVVSARGETGAEGSAEGAAEVAASPTPQPPSAVPAATVEYDGEVFQLARSRSSKHLQTDEYTLAGEQIGAWTQLLTVQRLTLARPVATDEFLADVRRRIGDDGASWDVLRPGRLASVFAVRFPRSPQNEEQVMICLALVEAADPATLSLVQYAIKPEQAPLDVVQIRIRVWRDRFLRQAEAADGASARSG